MANQTAKTEKKPETKAKETVPEVQETPSEPQQTPPEDEGSPEAIPDAAPETSPEAEEKRKRYIFPRQADIRCPGCGLYETVATSTQGAIQRRRCTRAIPRCERTFKITGTEVKSTDCKQDT